MSHYDWLKQNLKAFSTCFDVEIHSGFISAHGDKCYGYQDTWEKESIPFGLGVAIYFLTYVRPYSEAVRDTENGWVAPDKWVVDFFKENQEKLSQFL